MAGDKKDTQLFNDQLFVLVFIANLFQVAMSNRYCNRPLSYNIYQPYLSCDSHTELKAKQIFDANILEACF